MQEQQIPIINGRAVMRNKLLSVEIICPFCGRKHYHSPQPLPDYRRSHCPNFDGRTGSQRVAYLDKYPLAYKGGTYYIKDIEPNTHENELAEYKERWLAYKGKKQ